jgi:hypothetical protein
METNKKILVIGGTQMIGRDFVEYCLQNQKDYEVYIANRNITNPNLFNCKHIKIDRNDKKSCEALLHYKSFEIVVDFSCYNSRQLYNVLSYLKYEKYYVISTTATTQNFILNDKSHPMYNYASSKLGLENYINTTELKNNISIIRPCIVYGEHDYSGRFVKRDGNFYYKYTNNLVYNDINHVYVRDFTEKLFKNIQNNAKGTVTITGQGDYQIHPQESKYVDKKNFDKPFKHVVIDNLFDKNTYNEMCELFPSFIEGTLPYKDQPGATSNYAGIISGLSVEQLKKGYSFFASKYLQSFIEKEFDIKTTKFIAPSAHFHKPPSEDGFIHRDYNIVSFLDREGEFVDSGGVAYTDDTKQNPNTTKVIRSIALLYYLDNEDSLNCTGGGTGIYESINGDLIKSIEPKNNRLFIFEITNNSYHGFIGANFSRSCIVSWFHSEPSYMIERHKDLGGSKLIERWSHENTENYWTIEKGYL